MRKAMFSEEGNWYKGNLHSHTTNSDGRLTPEEAVKLYKNYGYSFVCFSEHDRYMDLRSEFDCEDFILLPGVEASVWLVNKERTCLKKTHHIHGILGNEAMQKAAGEGIFRHDERLTPPVFEEDWDGLAEAQKMSDYLRTRGCFTTYNHPAWSRVDAAEIVNLKNVWAMEVYNYGTVIECGEGFDSFCWDAMLRRGTRINGFASDDNHNTSKFFDSLGGYVLVRSQELTHEAIVNHLLAGDYYFSAGPRIYQWGIEDDRIFVECSDAEQINFIVGGPVGSSETVLKRVDSLNGAYHELKGTETYVRVECIDQRGLKAWTNPLWLRDIL